MVIRLLQAERDLNPGLADQTAALQNHLQHMKDVEVKPRPSENPSELKQREAEWYRMEAELWLAKAKEKKHRRRINNRSQKR